MRQAYGKELAPTPTTDASPGELPDDLDAADGEATWQAHRRRLIVAVAAVTVFLVAVVGSAMLVITFIP